MTTPDPRALRRNTLFVHIEKAAGSSFIETLVRNHGPAVVRLDGAVADQGLELIRRAPAPHILCGHFYPRMVQTVWSHLDLDAYDLITFLRRPEERVISQYYWGAQRGIGPFWDKIRAENVGLDRFVAESMLHTVSNWQTKVIANLNGNPALQTQAGPADLERAMRNLANFAFVGLVERYDESLQRLAGLLGLADVRPLRFNASRRPRAEELPDNIRAILAARNAMDTRLYAFAKSLFADP